MRLYWWLFTPTGDAFGCALIAAGHFIMAALSGWQAPWARLLLLLLGLWWIHSALKNWRWYDRYLSWRPYP